MRMVLGFRYEAQNPFYYSVVKLSALFHYPHVHLLTQQTLNNVLDSLQGTGITEIGET